MWYPAHMVSGTIQASLRMRGQYQARQESCYFQNEIHCFTALPAEVANQRCWEEHLARGRSHGFGWWFWKPALVNHLLRTGALRDGDTLVYCDAGCVIDPRSGQSWESLLERVQPEEGLLDIVAFHHQHLEHRYTKGDTFAHFGARWDEDFGLSCQLVGGYWLAKINARTRDLFARWEDLAKEVSLISDDEPRVPNPQYVENRHDQSLFSMLMKSSGAVFERKNDEHFNAAGAPGRGCTTFQSTVGTMHPQLGVSGLKAVVLQDVGWPISGDPLQPIKAARRAEGQLPKDMDLGGEGCY
ncbi:unnamed protein product [Symbiodinium natans]|uniref:Uncharacterized protein n=1 Tax=Symbiodinium natans TaxID=878477 RepID=A0A812KVD3_9DINO|nr:unnamed protein product [Symbiodinium natans]